MEYYKNNKTIHAKSRKEWRSWLKKNHQIEKCVWLIIYHKKSDTPSVYYAEAVEEALCFGWIDSVGNKRDEESSYLYFSIRKPKSNWSKLNRERVEILSQKNLIAPAGQAMIDLAKQTGTWIALEKVENLEIPVEMQKLFTKNKKAFANFQAFSPSSKKHILQWILNAKKEETKLKRITQVVELAKENIKANHP